MRALLEDARLSLRPDPDRSHKSKRGRPRVVRRLPKLSRRAMWTCAAVLSVLLVAATWMFGFSSVFALRQVVVEGVRAVSPDEVVAATELRKDDPLARIGLGAVEERVRGIPAIAEVDVSRRWPDTIVVRVVERNRLALLKSGAWFEVIDEAGFVFGRSKKRPVGLPLMTAPDGPGRAAALAVLSQLPLDLLQQVESIGADDPEDVVLVLRGDIKVAWGGPVDSALKADVLRLLILQLDGDRWIDVRVPANPSSAAASPTPAPPPTTESPSPTGPPGAASPAASAGQPPAPAQPSPSMLPAAPTLP